MTRDEIIKAIRSRATIEGLEPSDNVVERGDWIAVGVMRSGEMTNVCVRQSEATIEAIGRECHIASVCLQALVECR